MRKALILSAALIASSAAHAGYYERVPNGPNYTYTPPPPSAQEIIRQQQQTIYEQQQELDAAHDRAVQRRKQMEDLEDDVTRYRVQELNRWHGPN